MARTDQGFLLELINGNFASLDRQLRASAENAPPDWKSASGEHVGSLYQWTLAGDELIGVGTLTGPNPSLGFRLGLLRAPATLDGRVELLKKLNNEDFYLLSGYSYLASDRDEGYFLLMDKRPAIYRISAETGEIEKLRAFPDEYRIRPTFRTRMTGPKSAPAHYAELETFTMPAGLFAQDGLLYLLTRRPDGNSRTAWWLYQIDPGKDVILGRVQLPTAADHLTVVPGESSWCLIERGPVGPMQQQRISSMVLIPTSAVRSLSISGACSLAGK